MDTGIYNLLINNFLVNISIFTFFHLKVGVVSFGSSAGCEVGYPAGFSRTEYYLDWIMSNTGM